MTVTKRFIAGAVCPRCGEMDRLVSYSSAEGTFKECVACGFWPRWAGEEKQLAQVELDELGTRVNHLPDNDSADDAVQVVQFVDIPKAD